VLDLEICPVVGPRTHTFTITHYSVRELSCVYLFSGNQRLP